ncbi:DNA-binding transcriptional regulator, FrmR family [Abditibacterium utsteinense]|uniref:DNA-binding transcriptional regulator, FrmR family n=2 Tax=Abditibacterium utsteinense TaxID=1960156 RepID=A0A2S8SPS9_9BACT|nr:metal/formaldehyde-sensitive transcriptional repressor [Abditibacterium utsteinense]PQV62798.1 DNA-binding transcriptional regulator, FrmR family [Abditibacterium utsteinense]
MHTIHEQKKLLNRVRRIRGQLDGIERLLQKEDDSDGFLILQTIASCRGAINGLMAEVIEGHIREHVIDESAPTPKQNQAADELIEVMRTYLK